MDEDLVRRCFLDLYKHISQALEYAPNGLATYALEALEILPEVCDDCVNMTVSYAQKECRHIELLERDQRDWPELGEYVSDDIAGVIVSFLRVDQDYTMTGYVFVLQEILLPLIGFYFSLDAQLTELQFDDWLFEHEPAVLSMLILDVRNEMQT